MNKTLARIIMIATILTLSASLYLAIYVIITNWLLMTISIPIMAFSFCLFVISLSFYLTPKKRK